MIKAKAAEVKAKAEAEAKAKAAAEAFTPVDFPWKAEKPKMPKTTLVCQCIVTPFGLASPHLS